MERNDIGQVLLAAPFRAAEKAETLSSNKRNLSRGARI